MKVIFDTYIWLSYFLSNDSSNSAIRIVVDICMNSPIVTILLPFEGLSEIESTVRTKPYFESRISPTYWTTLRTFLLQSTMVLPPLESIRRAVSDPKDDFLVEAAIRHGADCLVTGDKALLATAHFLDFAVLTPRAFAQKLGEAVRGNN